MERTKTEKYIRISNKVYFCKIRNNDRRYWDCGYAWGPTPESAAMEAHNYGRAYAAKSVADYKNENFICD